ncbi:hypothetical protein [Chitinophaga niabensis]|uniref:DUF8192 domain-containing protein n=1 Tax=Chitinophaga niabensis TaxID=536979 RepID=A0A1N6D3Z3_9BACT|nr:hypothetical protein [Chitinophaga niabensis]SIN65416.1 hypothetical protein SAMN04488055_0214 [Chitinophaga niabensis]
MKTIILYLLLALSDNNPKLTPDEAAWLNTKFKAEGFSFDGKHIGFMELTSGGYWGIGKYTFRLKKNDFFRMASENYLFRLHVLDSSEKARTNGYDAIVVLAAKKIKGKFKRLKRGTVVKDSYNRYPQIPADAGKDNNPVLNTPNAIFFNELYKYDIHHKAPFDFTGKKMAIFEVKGDQIEQRTISQYLERIITQLNQWGFSMAEYPYVLTPQQKEESGGYDVIIQYQNKRGLPLSILIRELRKSGTLAP